MYRVEYDSRVVKNDISKFGETEKKRLKRSIETKLATEPALYGKALRRPLQKYFKLRVGDYRVIYRIEKKIVRIFAIGHRSEIYKNL